MKILDCDESARLMKGVTNYGSEEIPQLYRVELIKQIDTEKNILTTCRRWVIAAGSEYDCTEIDLSADGTLFGAFAKPEGGFVLKPWVEALEEMIYKAHSKTLRDFVLTVGIASNHGNWFTSDDPNKELLVLKQSYDWLLFLTDSGLAEFITDLILNGDTQNNPVKRAFLASYDSPGSGKNQFTKVTIDWEAHDELVKYFENKIDKIENKWFNILSPPGKKIQLLKEQLKILADKNWEHDD